MAALKIAKTYVAKPKYLSPSWHVFDAAQQPLGRMVVEIARILQGKHHPAYTAHINTGDYVVVVNANKVVVTGNKHTKKVYHFHSGYPGGLRTFTLEQMLQRDPVRVVKLSIHGMLPDTTMGRDMLRRCKIYPGPDHPHEAQVKGRPGDRPIWGRENSSKEEKTN
jgi:large subunit ribosomal protein L13